MIIDTDTIIESRVHRLKQTRHGYMLYNKNDWYVGRSLDEYGEYSPDELDIILQVVQPGMVVYDIGANIGALTIPMAQAVGNEGVVLAFEPTRIAFQLLCANIALNCIANVHALNCAIGSTNGTTRTMSAMVDFDAPNNFGGMKVSPSFEGGEPVGVRSIDSFRFGGCDVMKIDVEGDELAVLEGAQETIKRFRPILFVEADPDAVAQMAVRTFLEKADYVLHYLEIALFKSDNHFGNQENVFLNEHGTTFATYNWFCAPIERKIEFNRRSVIGPAW